MVNIINVPETEHWTICAHLMNTNEALKAIMDTVVRCVKPTHEKRNNLCEYFIRKARKCDDLCLKIVKRIYLKLRHVMAIVGIEIKYLIHL